MPSKNLYILLGCFIGIILIIGLIVFVYGVPEHITEWNVRAAEPDGTIRYFTKCIEVTRYEYFELQEIVDAR